VIVAVSILLADWSGAVSSSGAVLESVLADLDIIGVGSKFCRVIRGDVICRWVVCVGQVVVYSTIVESAVIRRDESNENKKHNQSGLHFCSYQKTREIKNKNP